MLGPWAPGWVGMTSRAGSREGGRLLWFTPHAADQQVRGSQGSWLQGDRAHAGDGQWAVWTASWVTESAPRGLTNRPSPFRSPAIRDRASWSLLWPQLPQPAVSLAPGDFPCVPGPGHSHQAHPHAAPTSWSHCRRRRCRLPPSPQLLSSQKQTPDAERILSYRQINLGL